MAITQTLSGQKWCVILSIQFRGIQLVEENTPFINEKTTLLRGHLSLNNSQSLVKTSKSLDKTKK